MLQTIFAVIIRIFSNSLLNVFQKKLTNLGQKSSVVNFYTYLGLAILCLPFLIVSNFTITPALIINICLMGILGALGNYFIIKALSIGELSTLAPINSYKPVVALLVGVFYLHEIPSFSAICALSIIIIGTLFLFDLKNLVVDNRAIFYRFLALIFSATEAIFIKKIILLTDIWCSFYLWCIAGAVVSTLFIINKPFNDFQIKTKKFQLLLILSVGLMQISTNYVFARMNVAYGLALFQLSTIVSVILGANIFYEKNICRKLFASILMVLGAIMLILL